MSARRTSLSDRRESNGRPSCAGSCQNRVRLEPIGNDLAKYAIYCRHPNPVAITAIISHQTRERDF